MKFNSKNMFMREKRDVKIKTHLNILYDHDFIVGASYMDFPSLLREIRNGNLNIRISEIFQ